MHILEKLASGRRYRVAEEHLIRSGRRLIRDFFRLLTPYWRSRHWPRAWGLLLLLISLDASSIYMTKRLNDWHGAFYGALQAFDRAGVVAQLWTWAGVMSVMVLIAAYKTYVNQLLQLSWRSFMTEHLTAQWLAGVSYYRLELAESDLDNPDQRIAEDIKRFIGNTVRLTVGLLHDLGSLFTFVAVLWGLSGVLHLKLFGREIAVSGYLVWVTLLYAAVSTLLTLRIGKPLAGLEFEQQRREADYRFGLVRVRTNAEMIAFYGGEAREQHALSLRFAEVVRNFAELLRRQRRLGLFTLSYDMAATVVPIVALMPRYFAREIQFGGLMQTANAFGRLKTALSTIIVNFSSFAQWKADVNRLAAFQDSIAQAGACSMLVPLRRGEALRALALRVCKPDGETLHGEADLELLPGDRFLIQGPSGCGKSTLLRALAGIWPHGAGELHYPASGGVLFIPQKPYMPLGTLREALYYPRAAEPDSARVGELCSLARLDHLLGRLDEHAAWDQILSVGEQQRVAFVRVLLNQPAVVFLDETSSALDEASEATLYRALIEAMPRGIVVSVGHRASLRRYHSRTYSCVSPAVWRLDGEAER